MSSSSLLPASLLQPSTLMYSSGNLSFPPLLLTEEESHYPGVYSAVANAGGTNTHGNLRASIVGIIAAIVVSGVSQFFPHKLLHNSYPFHQTWDYSPSRSRLVCYHGANDSCYDHEKGNFKYEGSPDRQVSGNKNIDEPPQSASIPIIECELRCDLDTWSSSLVIVIDPPPQSIACLRQHKLAVAGGQLWLTVSHDAVHASDE
ncbi:hypothetical protein QCA50_018885 [Cerrena zonata]|uniref:Uncharacterized protein n=1 Tax=Cerrena zonata TaxID=2478898 RepID=A0AAW0FFR7_9APHY